MKQSTRFYWLIGILFVLAACKPAALAATTTSTSTAAPITQPAATQLPTSTPKATHTPAATAKGTEISLLAMPEVNCNSYGPDKIPAAIAMPEKDPSAYHLKAWTSQNAFAMIADTNEANPLCDQSWSGGLSVFEAQNDRRFAVQLAFEEALARFPDMPEREVLQWRLALMNTWLDDLLSHASIENSATDRWVVMAIEQALNQGQISLGNLDDLLMPYGFQISTVDVGLSGKFNSKLDEIETTSDPVAVYHQEWSGDPDGVRFVPVRNLFGDEQVAHLFLLTNDYHRGGLLIAVHQGGQKDYELHLIHGFWYIFAGVIEGYAFGDYNENGLPEVAVASGIHPDENCSATTYIYEWQSDHFRELTQGGLSFRSYGCSPNIDDGPSGFQKNETLKASSMYKTDYYAWDGEFYQWARTEWKTDEFSPMPWEITQSIEEGNFAAAFQRIDAGLKKYESQQSEYSAVLDYLRFQRGLINALQGNVTDAQAEFQAIVASTSPTAISQATQAFLKTYKSDSDLYRACHTALDVMENALVPLRDVQGNVTAAQIAQAWGYGDEWQSAPLCDVDLILPYIVRQFDANQVEDLPTALLQSGVAVEHSTRLDLDGDSDQDWVVVIAKPLIAGKANATAWVLLAGDQGVTALLVQESGFEEINAQAAHETFSLDTFPNPGGNLRPVIVLRSGNSLLTFQILSGGSGSRLKKVSYFSEEVSGYVLDANLDIPKLTVSYLLDEGGLAEATYCWDAQENEFKPEQAMLIKIAEDAKGAMLQEAKAAEAIPALQAIVAYPPESCDDTESGAYYCDSLFTARSRYPYLLALAYELSGDEIAAVQAYWQLWHNFPHSPYALMARAKLEAK